MKLKPEEENVAAEELNESDSAEIRESDDQAHDSAGSNGNGEEESGIADADGEDAAAESGEPVLDDEEVASSGLDDAPLEMVEQLEYLPSTGRKTKDDEESGDLQLSTVSEARAVIEGFLFTTNEPLTVQRLSKLMNNLTPRTIRGLLLELQMEYDNRPNALQILEIAGGFQMATRASLGDWMFRMHRHKRRSALSPATLETLAIVAYKQPITKGEVEAIRGVDSSGTMRTLQDLNLVDAGGRREVIGRPQLFITTDQFLKSFGLRSLADLPSIAELRNLFANQQKLQASVAKPQTEDSDSEVAVDAAPDAENPLAGDDSSDAADVTASSEEQGETEESVENELEETEQPGDGQDTSATS